MKIEIRNNCFSNYKEGLARKAAKSFAKRILGVQNFKQVKKLKIFLISRVGKNTDTFDNSFLSMWDEKKGIANLYLTFNWMEKGYWITYGVKHELIHLRDIMNGWLYAEKTQGKEKMRVWWLHDDGYHHVYTKPAPDWLIDKLYEDDDIPYQSFLDVMSIYYPWEYESLTVERRYK